MKTGQERGKILSGKCMQRPEHVCKKAIYCPTDSPSLWGPLNRSMPPHLSPKVWHLSFSHNLGPLGQPFTRGMGEESPWGLGEDCKEHSEYE